MATSFYITTPIYYVNARPHIGSAYTSIAADVLARFKRQEGCDVKFLTGTDEHGQKVAQSAERLGKTPQTFCDEVSAHFRALTPLLNLTPTDFIRTTEARHKKAAQALWTLLYDRGQIYLGIYAGWYDVREEAFYREEELIKGKSPSGNSVEWIEEFSYFFKLSAWQQPLLEFYKNNPNFIAPDYRRNEILRFVESGLKDLSVSRSRLTWGIPVPNDGKHVMYVWIDALANYLTSLGFPDSLRELKQFWPNCVHLVGKEITRFHTIYWPALLMAADLPLPRQVFAHGWLTVEGQKMSKSLGNVIDPHDLVCAYGADAVRYFLLREISFGEDGDFSERALRRRLNADLANDLGNLVQRVLSFIHKYFAAQVPLRRDFSKEDQDFLKIFPQILNRVQKYIDQVFFHRALETIWEGIVAANRYVDQQKPWLLVKSDKARLEVVLTVLLEGIYRIGVLLRSFIPISAETILNMIAVAPEARDFSYFYTPYTPVGGLPPLDILFTKVQENAC
ncbi:MAG: methionine--tRNA ligase [Holosporales bacterium]|jgi:methionyl-tRNA synthetase|nr:methionine--tRNA ligase [Holosporales bacterium]